MKKICLFVILLVGLCSTALAWGGYDDYCDCYVNLPKFGTFNVGSEITLYDSNTGCYNMAKVLKFYMVNGGYCVLLYDYDYCEKRLIDMDNRDMNSGNELR